MVDTDGNLWTDGLSAKYADGGSGIGPQKMKRAPIIAARLWALPMLVRSNTGELRLTVTDLSRLGLNSTVELVSQTNPHSRRRTCRFQTTF